MATSPKKTAKPRRKRLSLNISKSVDQIPPNKREEEAQAALRRAVQLEKSLTSLPEVVKTMRKIAHLREYAAQLALALDPPLGWSDGEIRADEFQRAEALRASRKKR